MSFQNTYLYHRNMLNMYQKNFEVDVFCVINNANMLEYVNNMMKPKCSLNMETLSDDFQKILDYLKCHESYKKNLEYMQQYESNMMCKKELPFISTQNVLQMFQLRKGIEMIEEHEKRNDILYDIFMCIKYEFITTNYYNFSVLFDNNLSFEDILTCRNKKNKTIFDSALKHYNIENNAQFINYLHELKIDRYAGRIYTEHMRNLNFGGHYVKNYETVLKINFLVGSKRPINNLVYLCNDNMLFTLRENANKFKYVISSFGQHKLDDTIATHIFTTEYQLLAFCYKNSLLPIMYSDYNQGGIYKSNIDIMNNCFIPENGTILLRNKQCEKINGMYVFNELPSCSFKYLIPYGYFGEKIKFSFTCETSNNINLSIIFLDSHSTIFCEHVCTISSGLFEKEFDLNIDDKFYVLFEFTNLNNLLTKFSDIKIYHDELIMHYIIFITEGTLYEDAYDLSECDEILKQLTQKYVDRYHVFRYHDLDNPSEKKYISTAPNNKRQIADYNKNSEKIAFFKWKPYIIYKYLSQLPPNHILVYRDSNIKKYKTYLRSFETIKHECTQILHNVPQKLWFMHENLGIKSIFHQKKILTNAFGIRVNEFFLNHDLVNAATVVCKKTDWTMNFMKRWLDGCLNDDFINHEYIENEHFTYRWHCNDQAVLNSVIVNMKQQNELDMLYPYYINYDRELTFAKCTDLRKPLKYEGFVLNKIHLIGDIPVYSNGCKLVRNNDFSLNFVRSADTEYTPFQWIGYEVSPNGKYNVTFDIKFNNFIPDTTIERSIGFKTHYPERLFNEWIQECKLGEWYSANITFQKPNDDVDLFILIFDNSKPSLNFDLKNFVYEKL